MSSKTQKIGKVPGSLTYVGNDRDTAVSIQVIDYDSQELNESTLDSAAECERFKQESTVSWLNFDGIHDAEMIKAAGQAFDLHPLLMEDIMNSDQRPKLEEFEHCTYFTLKMISVSKTGKMNIEQVSVVLAKNWVLSFQQRPGDIFDPIRNRIRAKKGRVRDRGPDYLVYLLLDIVVDQYFMVTEYLEKKVESLEKSILLNPSEQRIQDIRKLKKKTTLIRRSILPLVEGITALSNERSELIEERHLKYFRDLQDHIAQVRDSLDLVRESLVDLQNLIHSTLGAQMNSVMKVLTIISTIFIPLTFIAGIYGMNFTHMPELSWQYGYAAVWIIMLITTGLMVYLFRRNKWF